jgi:hypothetical protein
MPEGVAYAKAFSRRCNHGSEGSPKPVLWQPLRASARRIIKFERSFSFLPNILFLLAKRIRPRLCPFGRVKVLPTHCGSYGNAAGDQRLLGDYLLLLLLEFLTAM